MKVIRELAYRVWFAYEALVCQIGAAREARDT